MSKYKLIKLTQGQTAKVDSEDFYRVSKHKWCAGWTPHSRSFRAMRRVILDWRQNRGMTVLMHREIVKAKEGEEVDHINGDSLDNRKHNLRKCTGSQNRRNRVGHKLHSSKYKGVSWHKTEEKWRARVYCDKKLVFEGRFKDELEAAKAYDREAKKFHKDFARTNF